MTPEDIAAIIDVAQARGVLSMSVKQGDDAIAFTLPQQFAPEVKTDTEDTQWAHTGLKPPNLLAQRQFARIARQEAAKD